MNRKILIAGGNGFIGRHLTAHLRAQGDRVIILTRKPSVGLDEVTWDGANLGAWQQELEGVDVLINLCGKSVNCRYTQRNRAEIYASRLDPTRILAIAMANTIRPPKVWFNASSATIYRHAEDREMDEATGELGSGFSVDVCRRWEQAFLTPDLPGVRRIALRSSMTFGKGKGGVFAALHLLVKLGLGGTLGNGRQYVSWIHIRDFCRGIDWMLEHPELQGPINLTAPNPLTNRNFLAILRRVSHRRLGLPAVRWMLEVGAFVLQTEAELLVKSRRAVPHLLAASGFKFDFPEWSDAAQEICQ